MTGQCQCDWHKLQYCWLCEDDFTDHHYTETDRNRRQDDAYLATAKTDDKPLLELMMDDLLDVEATISHILQHGSIIAEAVF